MSFHHLSAAVERIAYQLSAGAPKTLIAYAQNALDEVADTRSNNNPADIARLTRVTKLLSDPKGFTEKVSELLTKETNLNCTVRVAPMGGPTAMVIPRFKDVRIGEMIKGKDRIKGNQYQDPSKIPEIFKSLTDAFDKKTGRLDKSFKDVVSLKIVLSTEVFTSAEDYGPANALTAEEIVAIILHEVGHGTTFVEMMGDSFYRATEARDAISLLSENGDPVSNTNLVKHTRKQIGEKTDGTRRKAYEDMLDAAALDPKKEAAIACHILMEMIVGFLVLRLVWGIVKWPLKPLTVYSKNVLIKNLTAAADAANGTVKSSDTLNAIRNASVTERVADEYVSRIGLGRPLISGLNKLSQYETLPKVYESALVYTLAQVLSGSKNIMTMMFPPPMAIPGASPYDEPGRRMAILVQNNMSVFKTPNLPSNIRDEWIKETEGAIDELAKYNARWSPKIRLFIWETLLKLAKADTHTGAFINANLAADYHRLQEVTRGLIRSPLWFSAAQLQQLMEKK